MSVNMLLPQPTASAFRSGQSKYYKIWEGNLDGVRQGQPVFITRLEGYRNDSASEMLAANWPPTLQIARLISQDHMNDKRCVGKADLLEFRALKEHGFLGQLQEKKLCCVIQLPSQTLLLAVEKECRLIGMLFPREMLVFKPQISSQQQLSQVPRESQDNISGAQTIPSGMSINQCMVNTPGPAGVSSGNSTLIPTPVLSLQVSSPVQSFAVNNNSEVNMSLSQQAASALQSAQTKYYKVWEGNLDGVRQGQPVFITRLEGYRNDSASERLAANWPPTMQIVRLISQDHMNNKQYVGRPDFLVFRALHQHGFLGQLQEKKLCGVIQLTSQTLLLAASVKKSRLIGMLFPGDILVFKPQISNQQQLSQVQQESYGNISGAQTVMSGMSINQNMVNGPGPAGVSSGNTTMIPTPDMSPQVSSPVQPFAVNNNSAVNMLLSQQTASTLQSAQTKYFKAWEGNLFGLRKGQPVFITGLEGYRKDSASEMVAANWPPTMHIVRLISQDHMNNKQCVGKADFLVFRAFCQHGFLGQLQEKKLCAVIQLPSRTLLLAVSEKACRLIGMLLPEDMVVFKSQTSASSAKKRNLSS